MATKKFSKNKKSPKKVSKSPKSAPKPRRRPAKAIPDPTLSPYETSEFKTLQAQWYKKLNKSGFKDLEHAHTDQLQGQSLTDKRFQARYLERAHASQHYYTRFSTYLARANLSKLNKRDRLILEQYAAGTEPHYIYKLLKRARLIKVSLWSLYYTIMPRLITMVEQWNRTNPHGLDFISDLGTDSD